MSRLLYAIAGSAVGLAAIALMLRARGEEQPQPEQPPEQPSCPEGTVCLDTGICQSMNGVCVEGSCPAGCCCRIQQGSQPPPPQPTCPDNTVCLEEAECFLLFGSCVSKCGDTECCCDLGSREIIGV